MIKLPNKVFPFLYFFIKKQWLGFLLITITATVAGIANSTIWPYITGDLVDSFSQLDKSKGNLLLALLKPLGIALGFWIFIELVQRIKGILLGVITPKFQANIRMKAFEYVSNQPYNYFTNKYVGNLSHCINNLPNSAKLIVDDVLTVFIPLFISVLLSSAFLLNMNPILAGVFFSWISIHIILSFVFSKKSIKYSFIQSQAQAVVQGEIVDSIRNHLNVKIFSAIQHELDSISITQQNAVKKYSFSLIYTERIKIILSLISIIGVSLLFYVSIKLWQYNKISVGDIVFIVNSTINIITIIWFAADEVSYVFNEVGVCEQSLNSIYDPLYNGEKNTAKDLIVKKGKIEFINVTFKYPQSDNLFSNKSLVIQGGQKLGLVGFSGSGKSTFTKLIMRLYDASSGQIKIDDQDIMGVTLTSLRNSVAFIQQEPMLFHRSIKDNIRYGKIDATDEEIKFACDKSHCTDFIENMPDKYDTIVGESGARLSGGQRQRIAIARAILKNSPILIMDEATSALDTITERKIQESLDYLMKDKTAIVIAHRLSTVLRMDRILVFDKGNIVEDGTHKELLGRKSHYSLLWNMQNDGILP